MKINIGVLKNQLSKYLHKVRKGEELTITDRNQPVAKIIPFEKPVVSLDLTEWLGQTQPIKPKKKQVSSTQTLRKIRDEE